MTVQVMPAQNPYQQYCEFASLRSPISEDELLLVPFTYQQYWKNQETINLVAIYFFSGTSVQYGVVEDGHGTLAYWEQPHLDMNEALHVWTTEMQTPIFFWHQPLLLQPVAIPKPWGQEVWYTGVEERGVACFSSGGYGVPIPYLLATMPSHFGETENRTLILLKILDPVPEEVFGDLYFELHEEKQEVYVVTNVDRSAWLDGIGQMRMGFSSEVIERAGSDAVFRQRFLEQVLAYRKVRKHIDDLLDKNRQQNGFALNEEVPVKLLKCWLQEIPATLAQQEQELRQAMESNYGSLPIEVGDVVKVPLNVPHSLQHGVRTIEFQTPVYERQILAFGQKVLTQDDWDTERGVEVMKVVPPSRPPLPILVDEERIKIEQVVDFSDFVVERVTLSSPAIYKLRSSVYHLLIVVQGTLLFGELAGDMQIATEEAVLLPASDAGFRIKPLEEQQAVFLVAYPK